MPVHVWEGSGPGLLLLQEIFGVSEYIQERGAQLAALGYHVVAPEIFWRLDDVDLDPDATDLLDRALAVLDRLDWDLAVSDSIAALEYLRGRDTPVGVIGYCFGGGLGFNVAAAADPDVLVSYYGSALPNLLPLAPDVTAASLHHFGDADDYLPRATVDKIVAELGDAEVHRYPGAGHAFDNPMPAFHHAEASAQAWQRTTEFLSRQLPPEGNE
nr:dienelactone hydrolase family protein [Kribbella italica]